jgi:methylmalonyl-CoA/ethylmalonyl-CoA epimerase
MTASTPALSQIGQIAITAHDIDRAIRFYRDTLGLPFLFQAGTLAFFNPASVLYYRVADIDAAYQDLRAKDVVFEGAPHLIYKAPDHDLWMAFFRDSEGNLLGLMCEQPRA